MLRTYPLQWIRYSTHYRIMPCSEQILKYNKNCTYLQHVTIFKLMSWTSMPRQYTKQVIWCLWFLKIRIEIKKVYFVFFCPRKCLLSSRITYHNTTGLKFHANPYQIPYEPLATQFQCYCLANLLSNHKTCHKFGIIWPASNLKHFNLTCKAKKGSH